MNKVISRAVLLALVFAGISFSNVMANDLGRAVGGILGKALIDSVGRGIERDRKNRKKLRWLQSFSWAQIQQELNNRGFDAGPADNRPGKQTRTAVAQFQKSIGRVSTGSLTYPELEILMTRKAPGANQSIRSKLTQSQQKNKKYVRQALNSGRSLVKNLDFEIRAARADHGFAIRFVREIGGTIVSRGRASYVLVVEDFYDRSAGASVYEAKILNRDGNTGEEVIQLFSQVRASCQRNSCTRQIANLRRQVYYEFQ